MDPTDLALCKLLLEDSRRPYRELADRLGLSVAAVHGRIQALREGGIIRAFTARIGHPALGSTNLLVWGPSAPAAREGLVDRLGADEHVYWVALAGAGVLYVGAYLRSIAELDGCVSFIVQEAGIANPTVGIAPSAAASPDEPVLDRLDARILRAMHREARKSVSDVAEEVGLSAKTVSRRLVRLIRNGKAEFSMEWYPDAANDIISLWLIDMGAAADRNSVVTLLQNEFAADLLFYLPLSNLPGSLFFATWAPSMKALKELQDRLEREERIVRVVPNILYSGFMFDTWRDDLLMRLAGPTRA